MQSESSALYFAADAGSPAGSCVVCSLGRPSLSGLGPVVKGQKAFPGSVQSRPAHMKTQRKMLLANTV